MYLTPDAVDALFAFVRSLPAGSEIAFTFAGPEANEGAAAAFSAMAAEVGEPWLSRFDPDILVSKLTSAGFTRVHLLDRDELVVRYFTGRADGLPPPRGRRIGSAMV